MSATFISTTLPTGLFWRARVLRKKKLSTRSRVMASSMTRLERPGKSRPQPRAVYDAVRRQARTRRAESVMFEPNDLPLICLPTELSDEAAAILVEFLHELTEALERHYCVANSASS